MSVFPFSRGDGIALIRVRFLEPVQCGLRRFKPGDVASLDEKDARSLIACKACELADMRRADGQQITVNVDTGRLTTRRKE